MTDLRLEFVPPGPWQTLAFRRVGPQGGVGVFFNRSLWGFGVEFAPHGFLSFSLGPFSLGFGVVRSCSAAVAP